MSLFGGLGEGLKEISSTLEQLQKVVKQMEEVAQSMKKTVEVFEELQRRYPRS